MADTITIKPRGVGPAKRYRVSFEDGSNPAVEKTGAEPEPCRWLEGHARWDLLTATRIARALERYDVRGLEKIMLPDNVEGELDLLVGG